MLYIDDFPIIDHCDYFLEIIVLLFDTIFFFFVRLFDLHQFLAIRRLQGQG